MAQFRKKPVTIEATRYLGGGNIIHLDTPQWLIEAAEAGVITAVNEGLSIKTLEGDMAVSPGDWIIRGIKGEIYPCKPDIFAATYERVE